MEEAIRVCIRQRPLFPKEIEKGHQKAWTLKEDGTVVLNYRPSQGPPLRQVYSFDMCFDEASTNKDVYEKTARDLVLDTAKGINGCYMAYGQTGCGKTYSIMGTPEDPGILPRAISELFDLIEHGNLNKEDTDVYDTEYLMRVSYLEIYLERVNDLFQDGPKGESQPLENLDVKEDPKGGFRVVGLAEREVSSMEEVMRLIETAEIKRHFATTNFNETSSRSHTVFTVIVESTQTYEDGTVLTRRGELKLVDLAGNERATSGEGLEEAKERLAEGQAINKSLFLLSEVIAKLSKRAEFQRKGLSTEKVKKELLHIPWRDSKLTRLLQKALGGNSRACLLVAVHPSVQALEISLSTLRFAQKTKQIKKKIAENFVSVEQSLIMQQKETIHRLQMQLMELRNLTDVDTQAFLQNHPMNGTKDSQAIFWKPQQQGYNNETISNLKNILESKIKKLSRLILRTNLDKGGDTPHHMEKFKRSATITGFQRRYRKLETLSSNYQHQLYYSPKNNVTIDVQSDRLKPILGALDYLGNILNTSESEPIFLHKLPNGEVPKNEEELEGEGKKNLPKTIKMSITTTPRHSQGLKIENEHLVIQNTQYQEQIEFFKRLFFQLGLSPLLTCLSTISEQPPATLTYSVSSLPTLDQVKLCSTQQLLQSVRENQPLAYAMMAKLFCRFTARFLGVEQELPQRTLETFFGMVTPWEEHILALGYQQQDLQENMNRLVSKLKKKIAQLQYKLKTLMNEKYELLDHTARLIDELRQFSHKTTSGEQATINENFAKILKRVNSMSQELAARSTECQKYKMKYQEVLKERDELQERLDQIPRTFLNFDASVLPGDLDVLKHDEKYKKILLELIQNRFLAAESRFHVEESAQVLNDLKKINEQLSAELASIHTTLRHTQNDNKLLRFQLNSERVEFQKRLQESHAMYISSEKAKEEFESKLKQVTLKCNQLMKSPEENKLTRPVSRNQAKTLKYFYSGSSGVLKKQPTNVSRQVSTLQLKEQHPFSTLSSRSSATRDITNKIMHVKTTQASSLIQKPLFSKRLITSISPKYNISRRI